MSYWTTVAGIAAVGLAVFGGCALDREGTFATPGGEGGSAATSTSTSMTAPGSGGSGPGGAGGATSTSSQGGGGSSPEDCLDGIDNDLDQMTDCEDTDCQPGHECVPAVVAPWEGYYRVATEDYPAGAPTPCPDETEPASYFGTPGGPAQCEACGCGPIEGSCTFPTLRWRTNTASCSGGADYVFAPMDTGCYSLPGGATCDNACSFPQVCSTVESAITGETGCPPSGGAPTVPEMWGVEQRACRSQGAGAGCSNGMVCVAKSPAPYDLAACVFAEGEHTCPSDWPNALDAYTGGMDSRGCSACACDPAGADCVGEKYTVYDDNVCGTGGTSPPVDVFPSMCVSVQAHVDNDSASLRASPATLTGACTPAGGAPEGTVEPTGAVTFCCR